MHIKQVIISGFRSFRNQNEIEPFSQGHNVIVGRNGSGKSNFFDAIQFVLLAPKFFNLRQEDRQQLLHEGAGSSVMAAFVEIVFDNTGDRFSTETEEVVLRRTVGHKKDEFFLNKKRIQKSEVISLLETAGFSRSNPYYIVQQGKVTNLCTMRDKDRLTLLKEVSGTAIYEERRAESLKILQETGVQQERINGLLKFMDDRLEELETEKQELTEYESLDKMHRALEYSIYDRELNRATAALSDIEGSREEQLAEQNEVYTALSEAQTELTEKEEALAAAKSNVERLSAKKAEKVKQSSAAVASLSSASVEFNEYLATNSTHQAEAETVRAKLKDIGKKITVARKRLSTVEPLHEEKLQAYEDARKTYEHSKHRMEQLYGKQGRGKQFSTKKERDTFLTQQVQNLTQQRKQKHSLIGSLSGEVAAEEGRIEQETTTLTKIQHEMDVKRTRKDELHGAIQASTKARNELQDKRKKIWKEQEEVTEATNESKAVIEKYKQQLNTALPKAISMGLSMVEQIAQEKNLVGYYGPIIDIVTITNEMLRTAVEVAAGNALFHIVVDTDATASTLMIELEKRKAGRLTFLPLNRLAKNEESIEYPKHPDVKPLISAALEYDTRFDAAIKHVFGKKLLAKDLDTAAVFSKKYNFDVITIEGDIVSRKGGFEGGFRDEKASRIGTVVAVREESVKLMALMEKEEKLKAALDACDVSINDLLRTLQSDESERASIIATHGPITAELVARGKAVDGMKQSIANKKTELKLLEEEIARLDAQIALFEEEKATPLVNKLTEEEAAELQSLITSERDVATRREMAEKELSAAANELDRLTADLKDNLLKREQEFESTLAELQSNLQGNAEYEERRNELQTRLASSESNAKELEAEVMQVDDSMKRLRTEITALERDIEKLRTMEQKQSEAIADISKQQDKLLNKRSMLSITVQEKQRLLRDLVGVSQKELEQCRNLSEKQLLSKLKEVNEKFKQYTNVNRKALDQHVSFNQQREELLSRKTVVEKDNESIQLLINSLDAQKEEAILRTFEKVRGHFADVFSELVPGGTGELVLKSAPAPQDGSKSAAASPTSAPGSVVKATGDAGEVFESVQVRVSFVASGEQYDLQQLSGGQKALVALALIFAIQRSDPAPFYLFDELDQALDANYRAAVAKLIQRQVASEDAPAQFITTTFRPELVNVAQKCYGIALEHKVSNIYPLDRSDAQRFVAALMSEEGLTAGVTGSGTKAVRTSPLHPVDDEGAVGALGQQMAHHSISDDEDGPAMESTRVREELIGEDDDEEDESSASESEVEGAQAKKKSRSAPAASKKKTTARGVTASRRKA